MLGLANGGALATTTRSSEQILDSISAYVPLVRDREVQLRVVEAMFRGAFEHSPHGMAIVDLSGRWLHVNGSLEKIVGYTRQELCSITFQGITHPDDIAADLKYFDLCQRGGIDGYGMAKRYIRKDGGAIWIWLSAWIVRHPEDWSPIQFVAQIVDPVAARALLANTDEIARRRAAGDLDAGIVALGP